MDSVIALLQTTRMAAGQRRLVVVVANKAKDKCRRVTITPPFSKADTVESEESADKTFCAGTILLLLHHLHNERLLMTQGRLVTRRLKIEERFGKRFFFAKEEVVAKAHTAVYWNMCHRTPDFCTANL